MAHKLSANFTLEELCKSQVALRKNIDNSTDDPAIVASLTRLCEAVLQPLRDHFRMPFTPSSGYRCLELNRAIGSKDTSQHIKGEAADFEVPGVSNFDLATWVAENCEFDQVILEHYTQGDPSSGWVHCSVTAGQNRQARLTIGDQGTQQGLVA